MKLYLYISILVFASCSQAPSLAPEEYLNWFAQKELPIKKKQEMGEYTYSATILPADYFKARNGMTSAQQAKDEVDSSIYIKLEMLLTKEKTDPIAYKSSGEEETNNRLSYLISGIQQDARLIYGTDTLDTQLHHFERTYHAGNSIVVMFIFDRPLNRDKPLAFEYNDQLLGNGPLRFVYTPTELNKIPELAL